MLWNLKNAFIGLACVCLLGVLVWPGHGEEGRKSEGQAVASELMEQWKRANPGRDWVTEEKERHTIQPPADNSDLLRGDQSEGHAYGKYTKKDILMWERELEKFVVQGSRIFHDADLLGSSIAVSCDMCHPGCGQYPSGNLPEISGPDGPGSLASRHDQLVYRTGGSRRGPWSRRSPDAGPRGLHFCPEERK